MADLEREIAKEYKLRADEVQPRMPPWSELERRVVRSPRSSRRWLPAVAAACAIGVAIAVPFALAQGRHGAGPSTQAGSANTSAARTSTSPLPALHTYAPGQASMAALDTGILRVTQAGSMLCTYLESGNTDEEVIWPSSYTITSRDPLEISNDKGQVVALQGVAVSVGGGLTGTGTGCIGNGEPFLVGVVQPLR